MSNNSNVLFSEEDEAIIQRRVKEIEDRVYQRAL